jgi:dihydroorotate dehydrogenase
MLYRIMRPLIFALSRSDAEKAHEVALRLLHRVGKHPDLRRMIHSLTATRDQRLEQTLHGLNFHHPIGLAAGFDKNAVALPGLAALDFSFIEAGTITPLPQKGNPRPRLFRLPQDKGLLNRRGFNNDGTQAVAARLSKLESLRIPLGMSLGKGKDTPLENAVEDYQVVLHTLLPYGNYFVVNLSSPNTPGLRALQGRKHLTHLLGVLQQILCEEAAMRQGQPKPLFVKIAPDMEPKALYEVLCVVAQQRVAGIIAVNTTTSRGELTTPTAEAGGLSGNPLFRKAIQTVHYLRERMPKNMLLIGVGGIDSPKKAYRMLKAGANLLQIYTGLVYQGPFLVRTLNQGLLRLMERDGISHVSQLYS